VSGLLTEYADAAQLQLTEEKVRRESPDYNWLLKEYYEGILLFEIMEKEVWNKAMEDTAGQRNYFQRHAHSYKAGERMVGSIYSSSSIDHLQRLKEMLAAKDPAVLDFIATNRVRNDSGSFERNDRAVFSQISWSPGVYLIESNKVPYLIHIQRILPPGPKTFEEARSSIISDYQTYLENSWITELKRKFGVKVDKKAKKRAFNALMDH
jgi:peptidyl-prolyl cis-trans isomerase SurA